MEYYDYTPELKHGVACIVCDSVYNRCKSLGVLKRKYMHARRDTILGQQYDSSSVELRNRLEAQKDTFRALESDEEGEFEMLCLHLHLGEVQGAAEYIREVCKVASTVLLDTWLFRELPRDWEERGKGEIIDDYCWREVFEALKCAGYTVGYRHTNPTPPEWLEYPDSD